jgi:L-alanine-DL-glutamate epimerase-like enolase superfamily enzyme
MARGAGQTIEAFLSLPALLGPFRYTAVLGDQGEASFAAMAQGYRRMGFTDFKVKLSGELERDRQKLAVLGGLGLPALRVRVDANNLWPEAEPAIAHLRHLGPLFGVEEPIRPGRYEELARVAASLGCRVILDESFVSAVQFDLLEPFAGRFVINVRVSKMGGLIRSLAVVSGAHERGIPLIVGAQVGETSVLTRAGLTVAQAAFADLVAQEGAFGTFLLERDACEPSLMFGAGGVLDPQAYPALGTPGFGLHQVGHDVRRWSG